MLIIGQFENKGMRMEEKRPSNNKDPMPKKRQSKNKNS
jgi:hypothetical protein